MPNAIANEVGAWGSKRRKLDQAGILELLSEPLPAKGKTRTVFDSEIPSFAVRISPEGMATFCMVYSYVGKIARCTIGRFRTSTTAKQPSNRGMTAAEARRKALLLRAQIEDGQHPAGQVAARKMRALADKVAATLEEEGRKARAKFTLQALMDAYVQYLRDAKKPSASKIAALFKRTITVPFADLSSKPAVEIRIQDVMPVFHRLTKADKFREAEKLCASLRAAYTAACRAAHDANMHAFSGFNIPFNPLDALRVSRTKESAEEAAEAARERKWVLSEKQLAAYWKRINALPAPHGSMLVLHLMSGGQRVEQLSRALKSNLDPERKTLTLYDTKGRRTTAYEHVVPLLPEAEKAIERMMGDAGPYIFTVSKGKDAAVYHTLRDALQQVAADMLKAKEVDRVFTPGTIRKTVETRLAAIGVSKDIRARLQSHGIGGVQDKHYDAHDYDQEKRAALRKLRQLCEGKGKLDNVVPMRQKA